MPQQQTLSLQGLHHQVMAALEDMRGTVGWNFQKRKRCAKKTWRREEEKPQTEPATHRKALNQHFY